MNTLRIRFDHVDASVTRWMAKNGVTLLRISIGLLYIWFGALKLIPGTSPAEALIRESLPFLLMDLFIPFLGLWEVAIGLGFISSKYMRLTIFLMFLQMAGAASPLVINPGAVFVRFPFVPTLEGQYIFKNMVLIAAAIVVGATVRGGGLISDPHTLAQEAQHA